MEENDMSLNSQENADISDETKSDTLEAHSVSPASDTNNKMSIFEEESSCIKPEDEYHQQPLSLKNAPSRNCPGIASELETPQNPPTSVIDDNSRLYSKYDTSKEWFLSSPSSSSSSSCDMGYYENDEDLERFCEQEMSTSKGIDSDIEPLKVEDGNLLESLAPQSTSSCSSVLNYCDGNEDWERFCEQEMSRTKGINSSIEPLKIEDGRLLESLASSNNETGTPTNEIKPIGAERKKISFISSEASSEPDLLMEVSKFFAKNPIVGEVVDRNELITSRYFTDEFALQHGLTLEENKVYIRNELEQRMDSVMESSETEV